MARTTPKVFGLFADPDLAAEAVRRLRTAGVRDPDIQVLSGVPFPEHTFKERPPRVFLQWLTLTGGFLGALAGLALAGGTAMFYKIPTGHMDIVAPPPVGIITYEVMMLGAIVFTITGLALGLRKGRPKVDEPLLGEGYVGVLAPKEISGGGAQIETIFLENGATDVRTVAAEESDRE